MLNRTVSNATIKQVAKAAGVGTTTVSVILNKAHEAKRFSQQTIDHVKRVAEELGYQPNQRARAFRGGRTQVVGLALDYYGQKRSPLAEPYVGALTGGIQSALWKQGYNLLLVSGHADELSAEIGCDYIRQGRIDGLILLTSPPPSLLQKHPELGQKIVMIRSSCPQGLMCVYSDDAAGTELAVVELAKRGHRNLLWVGPREWYDDSNDRRASAFTAACSARKLRCRMGSFSEADAFHSYHKPGVLSGAARNASAKVLADKRHPTGILCYNAQCATGVYEAIHAAGLKIPEDISVIAFEEFASNFFLPHLSAISLRWPEVGACAAERLLLALGSKTPPLESSVNIPPLFFGGKSL